ncbi:MAG: hypothetical protein GY864_04990 [Desulfobacterales bacterium]|nr:hypothetical protein [Desulfobacterales bacterium]
MKPIQKNISYPYELDHKPGFFLERLFYTLFKKVRFHKNMTESLKQMHRQGTLVYAIKYRGHLDYLLYHYRFRTSRLPYPKIAFGLNMIMFLPISEFFKVIKSYIAHFFKKGRLPDPFKTGFFKESIEQGTTSLLCLVDPKVFVRQYIHSEKGHLHFLLETQKRMEHPIYIVPQLILYKMTPEKEHPNLINIFFGFKDNPGFIRKIALFFRHHRQAFIDFGTPLDLKAFLDRQPDTRPMEDLAVEVRQMLIDRIDMQKRVILGPVMKTRQQLKEKVLKDSELGLAIEKTASRNKKPLKQVKKNAAQIFDEIAADYNIAYIQFFLRLLTWLWKKIFEGIDVDPAELAMVREQAKKGTLIYIPSHKSHIDYLALNYIFYQHHMHIPRVAAGKNLAFWPMGYIFRKSGAFFIRRTFKGSGIYPKVFSRYIKALLEEGHPLEFFIEGGRSRSGKLILPKIGFLSILIQAHMEGYCDDLIFVPASISYDRILEEKSYLKEIGGKTKQKESFKQVLTARRFLKRKYGKIYIRFGRPLSFKEFSGREKDLENIYKPLAFHLIRSINKVTLATPLALIACAILTKHRRGFQFHDLTGTAGILLEFLKTNNIPIANTLNNLEKTIEETLFLLINRKVVNLLEAVEGTETFYYVDEDKKKELEYYKNSIIHCFISHAFVAASLLQGTEEVRNKEDILDDYKFMKTAFNNEFIYDEDKEIREIINEVISYFLDSSFITQNDANGGYTITRLGFDKLPIWAGLAKTFLESYWIATQSVIQMENKTTKKGSLLKNMNNLGLRFHKQGLIEHLEAVSQLNFENAFKFMRADNLLDREETDVDHSQVQDRLHQLSQRLYDLSHYRA